MTLRRLIVGYNHSFRIIMKYLRHCSASGMFVFNNVPSFKELWRKSISGFKQRVDNSLNKVGNTVAKTRLLSSRLRKHWRTVLYPSPSGYLQSRCCLVSSHVRTSPPFLPVLPLDPRFSDFLFQSLSRDHPLQALHHLSRSLSSPTNLAACLHPLQVNAQAPLLISAQDLVQPEVSNCIQLLQHAHTKCLLGGGLFFGGILRSTDSIDGIALKKAVFFPPGLNNPNIAHSVT